MYLVTLPQCLDPGLELVHAGRLVVVHSLCVQDVHEFIDAQHVYVLCARYLVQG